VYTKFEFFGVTITYSKQRREIYPSNDKAISKALQKFSMQSSADRA
jgi:hypothetical protein